MVQQLFRTAQIVVENGDLRLVPLFRNAARARIRETTTCANSHQDDHS